MQNLLMTPAAIATELDLYWNWGAINNTNASPAPKTAPAPKPRTSAFEVGMLYDCRSICDHECVFTYKIISRTDKSVRIASCRVDGTVYGNPKTRRVSAYDGTTEMIYPEGRYSMCPILTSEKRAI